MQQQKSYSQNGEDLILMEYFKNEDPKKLSILDIGANDGTTFSNSLLAVERGWNAALVEPAPSALEILHKVHQSHARAYVFPVAIGRMDETLTFYESGEMLKKGDTALVSSLKYDEINKWKQSGVKYNNILVKCVTFETFYRDCPLKRFDAISIDCEGEDLNVLKQLDINSLGCRFLIIEWNGRDKNLFEIYCQYFGMRLIHENPENLIFVK